MLSIAICDDSKNICSQIESIILSYSKKNCFKVEIDVFYSGESLIEHLKKGNVYDLIYLDIEMESTNGIEVGKYIRKVLKNHKIEIIYISGKNEYDRQLFDVQPLHFIPKPIDEDMVIADMKLAMERAEKTTDNFRYNKGFDEYAVPVDTIIYFESLGRTIKIVTTTGEDTFYGSMESVHEAVSEYRFLKIHRSYLVNYNHIIKLRYSEAVMSNNVVITISRSKRKELRMMQLED